MATRGMGSSTGTAPDHNKSANRTDISENEITPANVSQRDYSAPVKALKSVPSRSVSRAPDSLLGKGHDSREWSLPRSAERFPDNIQEHTNTPARLRYSHSKHIPSVQKIYRRSKSEVPPKSRNVRSEHKIKSEERSLRAMSVATPVPRTKSGVMLLNKKIGQTGASDIPGVGRVPMNGRVFGCVFFFGRTPNAVDSNREVRKDKKGYQKEGNKKLKDGPKARKERKSGKSHVRDKQNREKKREEKRNGKGSVADGFRGGAQHGGRKSERRENGSGSFGGKSGSAGGNGNGDRKKVKRSDDKKHRPHRSRDKTLCRVEIEAKKNGNGPSLVVKICGKK